MTSLGAFLLIPILVWVGDQVEAQDYDWAYEEDVIDVLGPNEWGRGYKYCKREYQSPVNIVKKDADRIWGYEDNKYTSNQIHFSNVNLKNNGLYLLLKSDDMSEITFNRRGKYDFQLEETRFHWGQNNSVGSENTFDGKSYPLENAPTIMSAKIANWSAPGWYAW